MGLNKIEDNIIVDIMMKCVYWHTDHIHNERCNNKSAINGIKHRWDNWLIYCGRQKMLLHIWHDIWSLYQRINMPLKVCINSVCLNQ